METIWKAVEGLGSFLFNAGTFLAGLAAFLAVLKTRPPKK